MESDDEIFQSRILEETPDSSFSDLNSTTNLDLPLQTSLPSSLGDN